MSDYPVFNISNILRVRDRLLNQFLVELETHRFDGHLLNEAARELTRLLPNGVRRDAVYESCRYLVGSVLSHTEAVKVAWRLAGNIQRLRDGVPAPPWSSQRADEWVPVTVLRLLPGLNRRNKPGHDVSFRVMAGTPCPRTIYTFWTRAAAAMIGRQVGFSAHRSNYPYSRANELVGLRMLVKIEAARSTIDPQFFEIACPGSMVKWNRDNVLKLRFRIDQRCPYGYTHACHHCAVGWEECPAGTHRKTYVSGVCSGCTNEQAVFDPERHGGHCITCDNRERTQRREH